MRKGVVGSMPVVLRTMWQVAGPRGFAAAVRLRMRSTIEFVRLGVDLQAWEPIVPAPSVEVRSGLEELERLRRTRRLPPQFYLDRLRGARRPYLGFVDGEIGHISWLFTPGAGRRLLPLQPDEVELDGAFTLPQARGRALLTAVESAMLVDARSEGYLRAFTHVAVDNIASLRGVRKTGFTPVGVVTLRWILGLSFVSFSADQPLPTVKAT